MIRLPKTVKKQVLLFQRYLHADWMMSISKYRLINCCVTALLILKFAYKVILNMTQANHYKECIPNFCNLYFKLEFI